MSTLGISLDGLSNAARDRAMGRFRLLQPHFENGTPLPQLVEQHGLALRTLQRWASQYKARGLAGLSPKGHAGKGKRRMSMPLREAIEGLALQRPALSIAAVHRKAVLIAGRLKEPAPSYCTVYFLTRQLSPALMTMAHEGTKAYSQSFDLIHRREADASNAIWQADHTELDILIRDEAGQARRPWLTIILDDYSRAIAGYLLSLSAPSAIQTALALRQAIWRKSEPGWHICGIPHVLYTDHGSDFTSQHLEQVAADLKIQTIFSAVGQPRGRGKIERFFESLAQVFLSRLPGYSRSSTTRRSVLSLKELTIELERYLIDEYLVTPHRSTGVAPQARWQAGGFLPQMPDSLERLDLLLLTVPKTRRVRPDGIHFTGMRYMDQMLAAYVGESILLRYDPRDMAEVRVFYKDRFLCRAVCQELAGEVVPLREIIRARDRQRRELRATIEDRRRKVDSLLEARRWTPQIIDPLPIKQTIVEPKLKRYFNE